MEKNDKKIEWIDNAKGLAMLAVVLGHMATPFTKFIFSWHMPMFFFLAGFFINNKRSFKETIKKDLKRLFIPFFIFGILGIIVEIVKRNLFPGSDFAYKDFVFIEEIKGVFFWMDYTHMHQYGFVLWFLIALFWGKSILQFLLKFIKNKIVIGMACLTIFFILANSNFIFPFSMDKGLISMIWMFGGYLFYNYFIKDEKSSRFDLYIIIPVLVLLLNLSLPSIDIATKVVQTPFTSLVYSFSVIILMVVIFKNFGGKYLNNSFLEDWGRNSLAVLVMHPYTNNIGYVIGNRFFDGNWIINFIVSILILIGLLSLIKYVKTIIKNSSVANSF